LKKEILLTSESIYRSSKIYFCIKSGIPVLLKGPTGTSKTLSAIYDYLKKEKIRFNLSSETTI
jgi:MoxR-like ATPase